MRIRVKFCGMNSVEGAKKAVSIGADAIGFVFFKNSPRYITPECAETIIKDMPPFIDNVGVFVNEKIEFIKECVVKCGLDVVQLHGDEEVEYVAQARKFLKGIKLIKAVRVKDRESIRSIEDYAADAILLDTYKSGFYGGTGKVFDRTLAMLAKQSCRNLIVSGGLSSDNVYEVVTQIAPYAVDVSSGIESSPGKKDAGLMQKFIQEVRRAETA
ncbi:MAG: phosphoribosylanthranilate isomerase [Candidatus Omnitrophica bacterium]|nr:phosphoribosylanthranilate isomerase [Candidatus Omnitrophota bacterium]